MRRVLAAALRKVRFAAALATQLCAQVADDFPCRCPAATASGEHSATTPVLPSAAQPSTTMPGPIFLPACTAMSRRLPGGCVHHGHDKFQRALRQRRRGQFVGETRGVLLLFGPPRLFHGQRAVRSAHGLAVRARAARAPARSSMPALPGFERAVAPGTFPPVSTIAFSNCRASCSRLLRRRHRRLARDGLDAPHPGGDGALV